MYALIKTLMLVLFCGVLVGCGDDSSRSPQGRLDKATKELATAPSGEKRFYALDDAAKQSFEVGKIEDARKYAKELLTMAPQFQGDWNYGNAIQDGNLV